MAGLKFQRTETVKVSETVRVFVLVFVMDGVGIWRQEHAEDRTFASNFASLAGTPRFASAVAVGRMLSTVVRTTDVVLTLLLNHVSRKMDLAFDFYTYDFTIEVEVGTVIMCVPTDKVVVAVADLLCN